jgi:uncharacterized membrane protein YbaN (DUF454 family)
MYKVVKQAIIPTGKYLIGVLGAVLAFLEPTVPFILICTFAVLCDCYTAWALSRRVKKKYPGANDGKFKSNYAGRVFMTLLKTYALIALAFLIENFIFEGLPVKLSNIIAGAVCFWQIWSMLENESSCNDARWAKIAQRILIDKTERHFDIDLHELKEQKGGDNGEN